MMKGEKDGIYPTIENSVGKNKMMRICSIGSRISSKAAHTFSDGPKA